MRCPLGSRFCKPTPWPASAVFRIDDWYPGVYILQVLLQSTSHVRQVLVVLICMCILVSRVQVEWDGVFKGFLPSKALFQHGGLYTCASYIASNIYSVANATKTLQLLAFSARQ
jgi:hypothetical protein